MSAFLLPERELCLYTACYCEENVWQLCSYVKENNPTAISECFVVFVSNDTQIVPLWRQKAGNTELDGQVFWDYHVFLVRKATGNASHVYDLDTTLSFPCDFETYFMEAIREDATFKDKYKRKFRVIKAADFLQIFASDRSHMKSANGEWLHPPPTWDCIASADGQTNNLSEFRRMNETKPGDLLHSVSSVLSTEEFRQKFS